MENLLNVFIRFNIVKDSIINYIENLDSSR